mgnify:CR=1 FL=1
MVLRHEPKKGSISLKQAIACSINVFSFSNDFSETPNGFCIPEQTIIELFPDTTINVQVPIDLGADVQVAIDELFLEWNYVTIESATLNLNENINLFFPTSFTYQVIGYDEDIIFDEDVFNNEGARLSNALSFILTLSYDENNLQELIPCEEENPYDPDGDPLYTGWTYNSEQTSISMGGEGSSFAIESIESINAPPSDSATRNDSATGSYHSVKFLDVFSRPVS